MSARPRAAWWACALVAVGCTAPPPYVIDDDAAAPDDVAPDRPTPADDAPPRDVAAALDRPSPLDASLDRPSPLDVAPDRPMLVDVAPDRVAARCDPAFVVTPAAPGDDQPFELRYTHPTGWTNIGLRWSGPRTPTWRFVDVVTRAPFTWRFAVDPTAAGRYTVTFTADNGATSLGACELDVASRGAPDVVTAPVDVAPPVDAPAAAFVTRAGTEFLRAGARFRFVGVNSAGLTHYGAGPLPFARVDQIAAELDEARRMGARVVRVFAAAEDADVVAVSARLGRVLDLAAARDLTVLVALTDFYASTAYHPQGDRRYYARDARFSIDLLSPEFFRGGFRTNYLPWARSVAARFASHPAVFAWELGNEIKCDDDHRAFIAFAAEVGGAIRAVDARHMITTGMITSRWMSDAEARELYALPTIDFVTYHNYNATREFADFEYAVARDTGRPLIVEEGAFDSGDRAARATDDVTHHLDARGARGWMQWGFTAVTPDNGNGDRTWGMDRVFHAGDYDAMFRAYGAMATRYR